MEFEVWIEGYSATGQSEVASFLGKFKAPNFKEACSIAMETNGYDLDSYNEEQNSHWGCRFFDNETDARKSFG